MIPIKKDPPILDKLPISSFLITYRNYKIDRTYQRDEDIWDMKMKAYLIDTIFRGFSMPLIYIHKKGGCRYIVDGQQRINTIYKFYKNKIELNEKYSLDIIKANNNKKKYSELLPEYRDKFNAYPINIAFLENYSDEEIRSTFKRLQSGKPLNPGEKLNSYPGSIVPIMRGLAKHNFFKYVTSYSGSRHKHLLLAAQLLYLEDKGITDINTTSIFEYVENNENVKHSTSSIKSMKRNLNLLYRIFREKTGEIEKPGWIISIYLIISYLHKNYAINMLRKEIGDFVISFYHSVDSAPGTRNITLNKFFEAISKSTTSKKNIQTRQDILAEQFIKKYRPKKLDENRLFSKKQKLTIFRRDQKKCKLCKKKLQFGNLNTHYHHSNLYIEAGATEESNGILVCKKCHLGRIHAKR